MSLINKMLRDLDGRHAAAGKSPLPNTVRALPEAAARPRFSRATWVFICVAAIAYVGLQLSDYWLPQARLWWRQMAAPAPMLPVVPPAPPPVAVALPLSAAAPAAENVLPLPPLNDTLAPGAEAAGTDEGRSAALKLDMALAREPVAAAPATPAAPVAAVPRASERARPATAPKAARVNEAVIIDKDPLAGDHAEAEYRKGIAAFKQGRLSEAAAQFRSVLREDPRHLGARQALLGMLADRKQWDEAQALLKDALSIMPTHYLWAMALARIQVERGSTAAAWETLQAHIVYAEKKADYQGFAGVLLQRLQRPHEAAAHFRAAAQLNPGEGRWWLGLGMALEAEGRPGEAREAFVRAQGADGMSPQTQAFVDKKLRTP